MTGSAASVILVGELNPYGGDPSCALLDDPVNSAGDRLRRKILGLSPEDYFGRCLRTNLCWGTWSWVRARAAAAFLLETVPDVPVVLLGRKVTEAFCRHLEVAVAVPFSRVAFEDRVLVSIPHPSGRCLVWNEPGAVGRARELLSEACPSVAWGTADA